MASNWLGCAGVALILHPNVWARYGRMQIESWLAEAMNAGLMLVPPWDGWRAHWSRPTR
jgi:hypothetical protein